MQTTTMRTFASFMNLDCETWANHGQPPHWSVAYRLVATLELRTQNWAVVTETIWSPKVKIFTIQTFTEKVFRPLVINVWVDKEPGLFPIEVLVVAPLLCLISQFRIRYTSIISGDLVHMSCVAHAFLTMQNTHHSAVSWWVEKSTEPEVACWSFRLPSFLTSPISESSDRSWCDSTAVISLPQVTSVHYVETTCVPRASSKRWKMIWKRHLGNWAKRNEGCFQEGWTAMGRIHTAQAAFRNNGCCNTAPASRSPVRRLGANPEKWRTRLKGRSQDSSPHPVVLPIFFGRNACLFGENKPTVLMDNAGEGTPGTGLCERKLEQKKPFELPSVSSLTKTKKS